MAIKKYGATADNTIVNAYQPNLTTRGTGANAGLADVLETFSIYGRVTTSSQELSRILVQFPTTTIATDRTKGDIPGSGSVSFYLRLYNAEHSKTVPTDYTLTILGVSQSWQEGVGLDLEGYKDLTVGNQGSNWMSASNTAYWTDINGTLLAGGSYHTGGINADVDTEIHTFTQNFTTGLEDLDLDITPLVEQWLDGTYPNYGVGVHLSASYEAYESGSADNVVSRTPGLPALDADDSTQSVIYNPSGSTVSYYTKRFFARGTEFFFKKPTIEARWNSATTDDRGNFFFSSSLAPPAKNVNTIYFYNYIDGKLSNIPPAYGGTWEKRLYVSLYSGSTGGFYADQGGGDGNDIGPCDIRLSGGPAPSQGTGSIQILSVDEAGHVRSGFQTVVTGGIVSTGVYSASFAFTGATQLKHIYDVWFTGSHTTKNANDALVQYFTGTIPCNIVRGQNRVTHPSYYMNITNLKDKYRANENARFNLYVRDKYWDPTIYTVATLSPPTTNIISASYRVYRVLDAYDAVPYGTGSDLQTLMSYDVSGNYFDLDMKLLEPGYEYAFKFSFYNNVLNSWVEQPDVFKFRVEDYEY
ncbi:hypothetical protein CMI47_18445 [Candidatus Pacearchaeota archaeon]|nr:hypothetical protein [Candidatus Pacearchaeota archaeon]|tara:strand:- start:2606 stop:4357 length:1752 start_codon:yes stop_codon:yes gene_type:complete